MTDFMEALNLKEEETEKPVDPPQGTYTWAINKVPTVETSKSGEWTIVEFPLIGVSAEEDVDEEALELVGGADKVYARISFMAPTDEDKDNDRKKTLDRIWKFIERVLRVDDHDEMNLREALDASKGYQFLGQLVWEPRKDDPDQINIEIKNVAPLD